MAQRLPRFNLTDKLVGPEGQPDAFFLRTLNNALKAIEARFTQSEAIVRRAAIIGSFVSPQQVLTASVSVADTSKATITIADHDRTYGDGISVDVSGGSIDLLTFATIYYIYYDQESLTGGTVTYVTTTDPLEARQTGAVPYADRHCVGYVKTPATSGSSPVLGYGPPPFGNEWRGNVA